MLHLNRPSHFDWDLGTVNLAKNSGTGRGGCDHSTSFNASTSSSNVTLLQSIAHFLSPPAQSASEAPNLSSYPPNQANQTPKMVPGVPTSEQNPNAAWNPSVPRSTSILKASAQSLARPNRKRAVQTYEAADGTTHRRRARHGQIRDATEEAGEGETAQYKDRWRGIETSALRSQCGLTWHARQRSLPFSHSLFVNLFVWLGGCLIC